MAGDLLISPQITVRLLRTLTPAPAPAVTAGTSPLTGREREIVRLVAEGLTNAEIGARLFITAGTAKTHIANAQAKLGARNRVGIAAWAWEHGLAGGARQDQVQPDPATGPRAGSTAPPGPDPA
ncbi:response regulator transcription factor [Streptomyces sp. NPDC057702]|uniref:response regulator transcription factor n=1 Tax=unclassified Streptomyces TaxID=2593676 RepID=UPI0036889D18